MKKMTDKRVAELFCTSIRNLQQTYKNPRPTKSKPVHSDKELADKAQQYRLLRLGAFCLEHSISEDDLAELLAIRERKSAVEREQGLGQSALF